jgi:hypothetical protein
MALNHSRRRWFGTCSCKPVPKGPPSSVKQLRTTRPLGLSRSWHTVTYHSVWLDGVEQDLNFTVFSGYALGWAPAIVTNFQIDGNSSATTWGNVYLDEISVYRW